MSEPEKSELSKGELSEAELAELFGLADMNLGAYVEMLDKLLFHQPKMSRRTWQARICEATADFDGDDLRVLLAVAVVRLREVKDCD